MPRIRRVREDAVPDDAVMVALNDEAEIYAPTLLEVAKLAFNRPLPALGFVGILESRDALRHRIERLLNFKTPGRAGLSAVWILALTAFTAIAVPMGEPPEKGLSTSELNGAQLLPRPVRAEQQYPGQSLSQTVQINAPQTANGSNVIDMPGNPDETGIPRSPDSEEVCCQRRKKLVQELKSISLVKSPFRTQL